MLDPMLGYSGSFAGINEPKTKTKKKKKRAGKLVAENIRVMMEKKRAFQTLRIAVCHYYSTMIASTIWHEIVCRDPARGTRGK